MSPYGPLTIFTKLTRIFGNLAMTNNSVKIWYDNLFASYLRCSSLIKKLALVVLSSLNIEF